MTVTYDSFEERGMYMHPHIVQWGANISGVANCDAKSPPQCSHRVDTLPRPTPASSRRAQHTPPSRVVLLPAFFSLHRTRPRRFSGGSHDFHNAFHFLTPCGASAPPSFRARTKPLSCRSRGLLPASMSNNIEG